MADSTSVAFGSIIYLSYQNIWISHRNNENKSYQIPYPNRKFVEKNKFSEALIYNLDI